jgi:hypothetical protein
MEINARVSRSGSGSGNWGSNGSSHISSGAPGVSNKGYPGEGENDANSKAAVDFHGWFGRLKEFYSERGLL